MLARARAAGQLSEELYGCCCLPVDAADISRRGGPTSRNGAAKALARLCTFAFATLAAARAATATESQAATAVTAGDATWPLLFTERGLNRLCLVDREADAEGERIVAPLGSSVVFCAASTCERL